MAVCNKGKDDGINHKVKHRKPFIDIAYFQRNPRCQTHEFRRVCVGVEVARSENLYTCTCYSGRVLWYLAECDGAEIWCVYFQKTDLALHTASGRSYASN